MADLCKPICELATTGEGQRTMDHRWQHMKGDAYVMRGGFARGWALIGGCTPPATTTARLHIARPQWDGSHRFSRRRTPASALVARARPCRPPTKPSRCPHRHPSLARTQTPSAQTTSTPPTSTAQIASSIRIRHRAPRASMDISHRRELMLSCRLASDCS